MNAARRRGYRVFVCSFSSGLDSLKRRDQASLACVLAHLHVWPRFSVFEAAANAVIARTMTRLVDEGYMIVDTSPGFPWSLACLTAKGRALVTEQQAALLKASSSASSLSASSESV